MMQEFTQEITNTIQKNLKGVHTAFPGVITKFDPAACQASVQPSMKFKKPDGKTIDYPQVSGVPVVFPQCMGQNATIAYPIKPGDGCLVVVAEQSIDYWMYEQETETDLAFDMSNSICIVGLMSKANPAMQSACDDNAVVVDVSGTRITVKEGEIQIDAAEITINGKVTVNGGITATEDIVAEGGISGAHHTHTGDSGGSTSQPR